MMRTMAPLSRPSSPEHRATRGKRATPSGLNDMMSRMDTNKNRTVSREEYAQFLVHRNPTGREFNYLVSTTTESLRITNCGASTARWAESIG